MNKYEFREKMIKFLNGRYGIDGLSIFLMIMSIILVNFNYLIIIGYLFIILAIYRTYSRKIQKRKRELEIYNKIIGNRIKKIYYISLPYIIKIYKKIKKKYNYMKIKHKEKDKYIFFKCKKCKKTLKVPKNKGDIIVTCPVCKTKTKKNT